MPNATAFLATATFLYYRAVTWMDAAVGRMLAALDRHGLADDTPWLRGAAPAPAPAPDDGAPVQRCTFFETRKGAGVYDRHLVYFTRRAPDGTLASTPEWLADLRHDPLERSAAAGTSVAPEDAASLRRLLGRWNERTPFGY